MTSPELFWVNFCLLRLGGQAVWPGGHKPLRVSGWPDKVRTHLWDSNTELKSKETSLMCMISQIVWVWFELLIISGTTEMIPLLRTEESKDAGHTNGKCQLGIFMACLLRIAEDYFCQFFRYLFLLAWFAAYRSPDVLLRKNCVPVIGSSEKSELVSEFSNRSNFYFVYRWGRTCIKSLL